MSTDEPVSDPVETARWVDALSSADAPDRFRAALLLAEGGDSRALPVLQEALDSTDENTRWQADRAIGKMSETLARQARADVTLEHCRTLMASAEPGNRSHAAGELGILDDPRVVPCLRELVEDEDEDVRRYAAGFLLKYDYERGFSTLLSLLRPSVNSSTRVMALAMLGDLRDSRAVDALVECLRDTHRGVTRFSAEALAKIADPRSILPLVEALRDSTDPHTRWNSSGGLLNIGEPAVAYLLPLLESDDPAVRVLAAAALGKHGNEESFRILAHAFDAAPWIGHVASAALARIGDARSIDVLVNVRNTHYNADMRTLGAYWLDRLKDRREAPSHEGEQGAPGAGMVGDQGEE